MMATTQPKDMTAQTAIFFDLFIFNFQIMAAGMIIMRTSVRTESPAVVRKKLTCWMQVPAFSTTLPFASCVSVL
jgi:hypothetical protein